MDKVDLDNPVDKPYFNPYQLEPLVNALKYESRFVLSEPYKTFAETLIARVHTDLTSMIPAGTILFRGRLNPIDFHDNKKEIPPYPAHEMGPPPLHLAIPGRINPEGISYLYCAEELDTAASELRPWKGAKITIAEIEVVKDIPIVDLSLNGPAIDIDLIILYEDFTRYFSVQWPPDMKLNYLPSQFFAEHLKSKGLHGIKYKSEFNLGGNNLALFYEEDYKIVDTYNVENIDVTYCIYRDKRNKDEKSI
jgi:hypothetical protein